MSTDLAYRSRHRHRHRHHRHHDDDDDDTTSLMGGSHAHGSRRHWCHHHHGAHGTPHPAADQPAAPVDPETRIAQLTSRIAQLDSEYQQFQPTYDARLAEWNHIRPQLVRVLEFQRPGRSLKHETGAHGLLRELVRVHRRWQEVSLAGGRFVHERQAASEELRQLRPDEPAPAPAPQPPALPAADEDPRVAELRRALRRQNRAWAKAIKRSLILSDGGMWAVFEHERLMKGFHKPANLFTRLLGIPDRRAQDEVWRLHSERLAWLEDWRASEEVLQPATRVRDEKMAEMARLVGGGGEGEGEEAPPVYVEVEAGTA
ncbi:hypothetical protein GE09DRAFT_1218754 [Coniochaeta sp. 2T2.1]|nr:hypothetical protein GE09DRAFT_1218754 [Coniochaeta sp. 2T2.1]